MTLRSNDLQSDSDLDSIRNSCHVYYYYDDFDGTFRQPGVEKHGHVAIFTDQMCVSRR